MAQSKSTEALLPGASGRAGTIFQSEIRSMSVACERAGGVNLAQGVCDLDIPEPVAQGAKEAIDQGINQYTRYDGLEVLRRAIAQKSKTYNKIKADPEKNIIITNGATGAFFSAVFALLVPGDEVIVFEPYYGYHVNTLIALQMKPVFATLKPPKWEFSLASLERLISSKTKAIMINTPGNPCGKVFTEEEIADLAKLAIKHDLIVFTDEIYEYFVYDGAKHVSPGAMTSIAERTVTIGGYSKTFSITGWRIGHAIAREDWARAIGYVNDLFYACSPAPLQVGVARGIEKLKPAYYESLRDQYTNKRDTLSLALEEVGMTPYVPKGAYYILADAKHLPPKTGKEKAMYLLEKTKVASVAGSAFYQSGGGENLLRFCFAKKEKDLAEAAKRLRKLR